MRFAYADPPYVGEAKKHYATGAVLDAWDSYQRQRRFA
jgi:hypothetical protein